VTEVAAVLKVSKEAVGRLIRSGRLRAFRVSGTNRGKLRIMGVVAERTQRVASLRSDTDA
jgi:excisionase family DNA binding protein